MTERTEIVKSFYERTDEETRLSRSRHGQLEYAVTMHFISPHIRPGVRVLEIGAGTGRYSIALAKMGADVTSLELSETNLKVLKEKGSGLDNLKALQGDAVDLSGLADASFDLVLVLGPLYHLYEKSEIHAAIDEAIRVTKKGGILCFAFLSVFGIMVSNYFKGNFRFGLEENFTKDYQTKHFKEQLFTGYDIGEFEKLFENKPVQWITTCGTDGIIEPLEDNPEFAIRDEDFEDFVKWYLFFCEKRELLGFCSHLLYICQKQ